MKNLKINFDLVKEISTGNKPTFSMTNYQKIMLPENLFIGQAALQLDNILITQEISLFVISQIIVTLYHLGVANNLKSRDLAIKNDAIAHLNYFVSRLEKIGICTDIKAILNSTIIESNQNSVVLIFDDKNEQKQIIEQAKTIPEEGEPYYEVKVLPHYKLLEYTIKLSK